jgi:acyl transferase domain-containing protein
VAVPPKGCSSSSQCQQVRTFHFRGYLEEDLTQILTATFASFGFGGANAHVILESYTREEKPQPTSSITNTFHPYILSAHSASALRGYLASFVDFLESRGQNLNSRNLAFTLNSRRSRFPVSAAFCAFSIDDLRTQIERRLQGSTINDSITTQPHGGATRQTAGTLAIFTGQGAQWIRMGAELVEHSQSALSLQEKLQGRLARLPTADRPCWSLNDQLLAGDSDIHRPEYSQPLCTAIQILLGDLIRSANIELTAAVGHSSGEIAAAYAAGYLSADDAICIAYYRGLHSKLAKGPDNEEGGMIAVGTSAMDAQSLLDEPEFKGRVSIAAINSPASITLSGDITAIRELAVIFKMKGNLPGS